MEGLKHVCFEQPLLLYVLAALAELITVAIWYSTRARWTRLMLLVWPLAGVGLGLLAWAVETDREKVQHCWERIAAAIDALDAPGALANVAEDFRSAALDKRGLAVLADFSAKALKPGEVTIASFTIEEVGPQSAKTKVLVIYHSPQGPFRTDWEVSFAPQRDGLWRVNRADCIRPLGFTLKEAGVELRRVKRM